MLERNYTQMFRPLIITIFGFTLNEINQILGIFSLAVSLCYGVFKFYKDFKK